VTFGIHDDADKRRAEAPGEIEIREKIARVGNTARSEFDRDPMPAGVGNAFIQFAGWQFGQWEVVGKLDYLNIVTVRSFEQATRGQPLLRRMAGHADCPSVGKAAQAEFHARERIRTLE
jgi:hypothetical protein